LHLAQVYDQMNLPNLACIEVLIKRRMLIEHAHTGRPDAPSYEGDEHFMGFRESADSSVVDPAVIEYTADKMAQKHKIVEVARKSQEDRARAGANPTRPPVNPRAAPKAGAAASGSGGSPG
jgi:hypothetical protein